MDLYSMKHIKLTDGVTAWTWIFTTSTTNKGLASGI